MPDLEIYTDPFKADGFIEKHVCSACWGILIKVRPVAAERRWVIQCEACKDQTKGYVTRRWAQAKAEMSRAELIEAKHALRSAVPWISGPAKTEKQLLEELGL